MNLKERINILTKLGQHLLNKDEYLEAVMHRTKYNNAWFTIENQERAIKAIADHYLQKDKLEKWAGKYILKEPKKRKRVGLVMAGNIPLVGFHDLICVFISGHISKIKLSEKDKYLLPYLIKLITKYDAGAAQYFEITERLKDFDAVIATGSNNSARYFETYFGKVPNIIRKNRNAVAVLNGKETPDDLHLLGKDVFRYFGLGCRNVSKIYIPEGYDFQLLLERLHEYKEIVMHHKYKNNFDYNIALFMMNRTVYWNNGCIVLVENKSIASRIATLHFEYYKNIETLVPQIKEKENEIQCVVSNMQLNGFKTLPFGKAQEPELDDYADGVDTMEWLVN
ncbi:MAG TPA: acyl-CoA reductase [Bacteroidetes bacterium]|nr:acyl-CoA reductase [Bacteroidota bacterium]